ncbi:hypothetical protein V8D89_008233, partial [Ganoderma adspersum]
VVFGAVDVYDWVCRHRERKSYRILMRSKLSGFYLALLSYLIGLDRFLQDSRTRHPPPSPVRHPSVWHVCLSAVFVSSCLASFWHRVSGCGSLRRRLSYTSCPCASFLSRKGFSV